MKENICATCQHFRPSDTYADWGVCGRDNLPTNRAAACNEYKEQ